MVVAYGSVDCNQPAGKIPTKKIVFESAPGKVHNLALLEIESPIPYSKKAKQARLPKITAELLGNTTKLTGWNVNVSSSIFSNLPRF